MRVPIRGLVELFKGLIDGSKTWEFALSRYPVVREGGEEDEDEENGDVKAPTKAAVTVVEKTGRGKFSRPNPPLSS